MKLSTKLFLLASTTLMTSSVFGANLEFQNIRVGGSGCPSSTTQIITAPDLSTASLLFDRFESHVPTAPSPKGGTGISLLNCNVFLEIKLPAGQKLDSLEIAYDMRGHTFLNRGVSGSFRSFLMSSAGLGTERGGRGPELLQQKSWMNTTLDQEEDFIVQSTKILPLLSRCGNGGEKVQIHLQHQLGTQILFGDSRTEGTITMDSSDMTGGIRLKATTSVCQQTPPGGGRGPGRNCTVERINGRAVMTCQ